MRLARGGNGNRNHIVHQLAKFISKALHRKILLIGRARLFPELGRERWILDQTANGGRKRIRRFRPNEQRILALDPESSRRASAITVAISLFFVTLVSLRTVTVGMASSREAETITSPGIK